MTSTLEIMMEQPTFCVNITASIQEHFTEETTLDQLTSAQPRGAVSQELISDATFASAMAFLNIASTVFGCLSVLCCVANGLIYFRQIPNSSAYYLLVLNICQGLHSASKMANAFSIMILSPTNAVYFIMRHHISAGAATCFRRTAICINALTSLNRYLAIAFPLRDRMKRRCGRRAPLFVSCFVFTVVVIIHSYLFYEYEPGPMNNPMPSRLKLANPEAFEWARYLGRGLCFYFPLLASLCFNIALLCALKAHGKETHRMRKWVGGPKPGTGSVARRNPEDDLSAVRPRQENLYKGGSTNKGGPFEANLKKLELKHSEIPEGLSGTAVRVPIPSKASEDQNNTPPSSTDYCPLSGNCNSLQTEGLDDSPTQTADTGAPSNRTDSMQHPENAGVNEDKSARPETVKTLRENNKRTSPNHDKAESSRTRLILTLTFAFFILALPRVALAETHRFPGFIFQQTNLFIILINFANCMTFSTDVVLFLVTVFHSAQFRKMMFRVVLRKGVALKSSSAKPTIDSELGSTRVVSQGI